MTALFPSLTSPIIDQGLTPEFSLCIKKLNKKDPITKTKVQYNLYSSSIYTIYEVVDKS